MGSSRLRHRAAIAVAAVASALLALSVPARAEANPYQATDPPALTAPAEATFVLGRAGDAYLIEAAGDPVPAIGADRLPGGLRITDHGDGSATLEGTPTGPAGTSAVELTARSPVGAATASITVTVNQAPAFVARGPLVFEVGRFQTVLVRTVGYPAPGIGLEGDLPAGLTFVDGGDGTARIAGTPVDGPVSDPITLTAANVVADATLTTAVVVRRQLPELGAANPQPPAASAAHPGCWWARATAPARPWTC